MRSDAASPLDSYAALLLSRRSYSTGGRLRIELWVTGEHGPARVLVHSERPVFFVPQGLGVPGAERKPVALRDLTGQPVDAVYFNDQRSLRAARDALIARGHAPLEADVRPAERFLMERFITGALLIEGTGVPRDGYLEFKDPRLSAAQVQPELAVASLDIETDGLDGPVLSIALSEPGKDRVFVVGQGPLGPDIETVPNERALLAEFFAYLRERDPDVLIGWNVVEFDLSHLITRSRLQRVAPELGRASGLAEVLAPSRPGQAHVARVPGRVVLDGMATLRAASYSFESFALEDVAQQLLGRGKRIDQPGDRVAEIKRLFERDKAALAEYNLGDCHLVRDIFAETGLLGFAVERQQLTGLPMDRLGGAVAAFDHLYLPRLHRRGRVAPTVGLGAQPAHSPGGYVMESRPGIFQNVLVLDFKSLYPSIIRTFKIDPHGLAEPGDEPVEGYLGARFHREAHILPGLIDTLWSARDRAKAEGDAARSQAIKILMNSFYGVLGTPRCRFFDQRLASSITMRGHEIITRSRDYLEGLGLAVIYGDTDSLFVLLGEGPSEEECHERGRALAESLNAFWQAQLERQHRIDSHLELEFETHYLRFFMPTMRGSDRGSKKRYAGSVRGAAGQLQVVIKGLEAVRTDWTPLARRFQRELLTRVFTDAPYEEYVRQVASDLRAGRLDAELVYTKRLRRELSEYKKNVPPHVQAARRLAKPGRAVAYYMTKVGPEPVDLHRSTLDYEHYLSKQLAPAADGILQLLGTDFVKLAGPQLHLF